MVSPVILLGKMLRICAELLTTSQVGVSCAILSLDQKAFDRVDRSSMKATLSAMDFGPSFIGWIDLLYCGSQSAVNVNEHVSPYFSVPWRSSGMPFIAFVVCYGG